MSTKSRSWTDSQLIEACKTSVSKAEVLRKLNLAAKGGNYRTISNYIEKLNIDTSHFTGQLWSKGIKVGPKRTLDSYLVESYTNSHTLKLRLISENVFAARCSRCNLDTWLEEPIPLELEHINGIHSDNRIENLCLLCPNCHAKTPTYRGKNQARVVQSAGDKTLKTSTVRVRISSRVRKTKILWPSNEELLERLQNTSYRKLGKELGVSDNAIRKHLKVTKGTRT